MLNSAIFWLEKLTAQPTPSQLAKEEAAILPYDVVDAGSGGVGMRIPGRHRDGSAELVTPQQVRHPYTVQRRDRRALVYSGGLPL